ncbi:MAG: glycosyltransferase family 1 protein [Bacteroidota bacterium]
MRIGYDAKRIFHNSTGLGNYGRDIVRILNEYSSIEEFFLFNTKKSELEPLVPLEKATIVYPKGWFWKTFPSVWRLTGQWKQINTVGVDGFHGLSGEIPIQFKSQKIPKIVTIHDLIFLSHPNFYNIWDRIIYKLKFQYAVNTADHVVAISEQTKRDIIKFLKVDPKKITVIYQGCNTAFKKDYSSEQKEAVRKKYSLPPEFVLNVGTLQERKNALSVIKAIDGTPYHAVLVGSEKNYAKKIHSYVQSKGLQSQVTFIKNIGVAELAMIYQMATVFCYPSICEGFGIPIIEALYSKIPVVVSRDGCFPEAAGPDSVYIDPHKPKEIRTELKRLFESPEERTKIATKGFAFVQRFSDEHVAKHLLALYQSVV